MFFNKYTVKTNDKFDKCATESNCEFAIYALHELYKLYVNNFGEQILCIKTTNKK